MRSFLTEQLAVILLLKNCFIISGLIFNCVSYNIISTASIFSLIEVNNDKLVNLLICISFIVALRRNHYFAFMTSHTDMSKTKRRKLQTKTTKSYFSIYGTIIEADCHNMISKYHKVCGKKTTSRQRKSISLR